MTNPAEIDALDWLAQFDRVSSHPRDIEASTQIKAMLSRSTIEIEELKHDIGRYIVISSDLATENERLRALVPEQEGLVAGAEQDKPSSVCTPSDERHTGAAR